MGVCVQKKNNKRKRQVVKVEDGVTYMPTTPIGIYGHTIDDIQEQIKMGSTNPKIFDTVCDEILGNNIYVIFF